MLFLTLSNVDVQFIEKELIWRSYTTAKTLPTIKRIKLINKKEFAKAILDKNFETFVIYVISFNLVLRIHPDRKAQIAFLLTEKAQIAFLLIKKVKILDKYSDFANVFSEKKALVLLEHIKLNEYAMNLEDGKELSYGPIYNLGPMELETLKTYIKTPLKTGFIWSFKFPVGAFILFDKKPDGSLCLCVDYQGLNNFTIKNQYLLLLIGESFNRLDWAKRFTQLDLTGTYYQIRIKEGDE